MTTLFLAACATPDPLVPPTSSSSTTPGLDELTGLHQPDILALLGKPDFTLDEPPAELWQYRAADCVLSLFFYREPKEFRLVRAETWQRSAADSATTRCSDENAPLKAHLVQSRL